MDEWIDYYDSTHTIYVSKRHRDVHFRTIANDIIGYIPSPDATVLDYSCGEALFAGSVADACARLILAEPAPGVRGRLSARFGKDGKVDVRSIDGLRQLDDASVDVVIMISVVQYMTPEDLDDAFVLVRRLLKPDGRFILGDVLDPDIGAVADVWSLLRFGASHGFLKDALWGLARTALSDYWTLRKRFGLQRYSEADMIARLKKAGFSASRAPVNVGHNPYRMTFVSEPGTQPA